MLGQIYQPIHPINIFIAALNEEEGVGATISELSENINAKRILLIDGHSEDRTVDIAKEHGAEIFFQMVKVKEMLWLKLSNVCLQMLSTWLSQMLTLLIRLNMCLK